MGCCGSTLTAEEVELRRKNKEIEGQLFSSITDQEMKVRLLLLGAGESGKSTIFKQMKILYGTGFSEEERQEFKAKVHDNIFAAMRAICNQVVEMGLSEQLDEGNKEDFSNFLSEPTPAVLGEKEGVVIQKLWNDPGVQAAWDRRNEYQVIEANISYFNRIDKISSFGYVPDDADILLSRVRTTGIVEMNYIIDKTEFVIIDVGGQRNERKKWIHCFDDVNAIIYVAALSEFDQNLFEDSSQNRMTEALTLFGEMCNSKWFERTDMILFLNKCDLFAEKIKVCDPKDTEDFADYTGGLDYDNGVNYFLAKFLATNTCNKDIYHHVTCATDTGNVKVVFNACKDIILKKNLEDSGFMG